jgi:hypothetical protein
MKKLFLGILLLALLAVFPVSAKADVDVDVHIGIPLPPAIVFAAPPVTVVIPETYIYAVPDVSEDIYFHGGWWWRPWEGRWYRSHSYDGGWSYYKGVPPFYRHVPPRWREDYRNQHWKGHPWTHQSIPAHQLTGNWRGWEKKKHWEKQQHWGVPAMKAKKKTRQPPQSIQPPPPRPHHQPEQREVNGPHHPQYREGDEKHSDPHKGKQDKEKKDKDKHGKGEGGHGNKQDRE